ncbi:MAG: phosphatidylglycerol lysyltransferase domain-containing protein [Dialister invisus]
MKLKGAIIRIYGKVEALRTEIWSILVAHIFFEKANPNIRGLYQAINRDFLMHEFAETEFVNREEDMGLPGLRQAKMEYNPDHFAEKYDVVVKDGSCF